MTNFNVNDRFEFDLDSNDSVDLVKTGETKYHMLVENASYNVELLTYDPKNQQYQLKVNGKYFEVNTKNKLHQLLEKMGMDGASSDIIKNIPAPMPGLVIEINVKSGDIVAKGDRILILEAMKMENILKSPTDGQIKSIEAVKGQNVEKNEVLVTFED